jgi:putative ABC transport system permease protein
MGPGDAVTVQDRIAAAMPGVVTVRTENILNEARTLLGRAAAGLAVIAAVSLVASLLVLVSVVAGSRVRKLYDASILHTLGARLEVIRTSLQLEYVLLAILTSLFAIALGSAIAAVLLQYRVGLDPAGIWWTGIVTAFVVSAASLGLGARYLLRQLRLSPAFLLRTSG